MKNLASSLVGIYFVLSINCLAQESKISFTSGHNNEITAVSFSIDGKYLYSGSSDGTVKIWDFATGNEIVTSGASGSILSIQTSPDGKCCFVLNADGILFQWDNALTKQIGKFSDSAEIFKNVISPSYITSFDLTPDGKSLLTGNASGFIKLIDIQTQKVIFD